MDSKAAIDCDQTAVEGRIVCGAGSYSVPDVMALRRRAFGPRLDVACPEE